MAADVSELPATGMPLGLFSASTYEAPTAAVPKGGALLLVSRGVVEAHAKGRNLVCSGSSSTSRNCRLSSAYEVASCGARGRP